jgi:hypothetical protein
MMSIQLKFYPQAKFLPEDAKFNLGFVDSPRRMNVGLSRARSLLIIVGNATLLARDPLWRACIEEFHKKGCVTPTDWKAILPKVDDLVAARDAASASGREGQLMDSQNDSPWRPDM